MRASYDGGAGYSRSLCLILTIFLGSQSCSGAEFVSHEFRDETGRHPYSVYLPDGFSSRDRWPVMLWLHGAGERGTGGEKPLEVGLGPVLKQRSEQFPFVVVFPQSEDRHAPILSGWDARSEDGRRALKILDEAIERYQLDASRQVLSGWSMGGYGTIELALAAPDRWISVVTLAGGAPARELTSLKSIPFWLFHGTEDEIVLAKESEELASRLRQAGASVRLTLLEETGHNLWRDVYRWSGLYDWMLNPEADVEYDAPAPLPEDSPILDSSRPFVSAVEVPSAAYVRLGNRMLEAVSVSIPQNIPQDVLVGRLNNIWDRTRTSGRSFTVQFSHISYSGDVAEAYIGAYRKDRVTLQLALSNVNLRIGRTDVRGRNHSAVAGPIRIVIGHREPVWLSVAVEPRAENRQLKLKLITTRFNIPRNNWYVTSPRIYDTRGFGMTADRVRSSLVSGLYSSRRRIEQQVRGLVPDLIKQFEQKLVDMQEPALLETAWPLPVYEPRVKFWPQEVITDELGITVKLGMSVAAYDPRTVGEAPRESRTGRLPADLHLKSEDLVLGMSSDILTPLTSQLVYEDLAHIHLEDITGNPFAALYERSVMERLIPALNRETSEWEIRHELLMKAPLHLEPVPLRAPHPDDVAEPQRNGEGVSLQMVVQPADLVTTIKRGPEADWERLSTVRLKMRQNVRLDLRKPSFARRDAKIAWQGRPELEFEIQDLRDGLSLDLAAFKQQFARGWTNWTVDRSAQVFDVPDLRFGRTRLRLESAAWLPLQAYARFAPPGLRITNSSETELNYQIRSRTSPWSETYLLAPGKTHSYDGADELLFRRILSGSTRPGSVFKLPAGSASEFGREPGDDSPRLRLLE